MNDAEQLPEAAATESAPIDPKTIAAMLGHMDAVATEFKKSMERQTRLN